MGNDGAIAAMARSSKPVAADFAATVTVWQTVLAPWRFMFRPAAAARVMYQSSTTGLLLSFLQCAVIAVVIVHVFSIIGAMRWWEHRGQALGSNTTL